MKMIALYKVSNKGALLVWEIATDYDGFIELSWGQDNGAFQRKLVAVTLNNSNRDLIEQTVLEINSRVKKQIDDGYCHTIEEAYKNKCKNALNLFKPMLAQKYEGVQPNNLNSYFVQYKYDGHRCLITKNNGKLIAYSRNGQVFPGTIDHILEDIDIDEGMTLDGELYCHGQSLQTISSWAKRKQPESKDLVYVCYDIIEQEPYYKRKEKLKELLKQDSITIINAPTHECNSIDIKQAKALGYEGLILRHKDFIYEIGKRSKGLLKVKEWHSSEFEVVDIMPSKDNWAILVCKIDKDKTFCVSCQGTIEYKYRTLMNKYKYIGKYIEVEYANLTKDGIPFHPVAIRWRDDE